MTVSRIPEGRFAGRCGSTYGCLKREALMVLDIILVAILVFFTAKGLAKGFVYTCLHTLGWIAAIVLAGLLQSPWRTYWMTVRWG